MGHSLWDCLVLSFCTLIVSYFKGFVKGFFEISFKKVGYRQGKIVQTLTPHANRGGIQQFVQPIPLSLGGWLPPLDNDSIT